MAFDAAPPTKLPSYLPGVNKKQRRVNFSIPSTGTGGGKSLSQSTLRKMFFAMMATVFFIYFLLVLLVFRNGDLKTYKKDSDWGPSLRPKNEILRHHMKKMAQEKALQDSLKMKRIDKLTTPQVQLPRPVSRNREMEETDIHEMFRQEDIRRAKNMKMQQHPFLTTYLEQDTVWGEEPLPMRRTTAKRLIPVKHTNIKPCLQDPSQFLTDDPFLPWIQEVFPTREGTYIHFRARSRCHQNISFGGDQKILQLESALFRSVLVQTIDIRNQTRYRLSHSPYAGGVATRFVCVFDEPYRQETLSTFTEVQDPSGNDDEIHFQCPVPSALVQRIRAGTTDKPSIFLTLVPIRTSPQWFSGDKDNRKLPSCYQNLEVTKKQLNGSRDDGHVMPKIEDSGRFQNIPICNKWSDNGKGEESR